MSQDSSHIEILRRGPRAWNAWRSENPKVVPNLSGLTLSVGQRQMGPINSGPINLSSTRLRHGSLRFATLTGADLSAADLWDADLSDARLDRVNLAGADLSEALLDRADFAGTKLAGANLSSASLLEARNLTQAQIDEAMGNSSTVLPPHLARPAAWTGSVSPVSDYQTRSEVPWARIERCGRAEAGRNSFVAGGRAAFQAGRSARSSSIAYGAHRLALSAS